MELELVPCPECGRPAEVVDRVTLFSTDGPIDYVKTRCITGRWFTTPAGSGAHVEREAALIDRAAASPISHEEYPCHSST